MILHNIAWSVENKAKILKQIFKKAILCKFCARSWKFCAFSTNAQNYISKLGQKDKAISGSFQNCIAISRGLIKTAAYFKYETEKSHTVSNGL